MASAEKRGTGPTPWSGRYIRPDGTRGRTPNRWATEAEALTEATDLERDLARGLIVDPRKAAVPLAEWAATWRAAVADTGATAANRWYRLNRWILPAWGTVTLGELNWFAVKTWAQKTVRTDQCSATTMDNILTTFSTVLTGAVDAGLLASNPLYKRKWRTAASGAADEEPVWITPAQIRQLYARLPRPYNLMILLGGWLGMRWGEVVALHESNVLLLRSGPARHVIVIHPRLGALHEIGDTGDGEEQEPPTDVPAGTPRQHRRLYLGPPKPPSGAREIDVPRFLVPIIAEHLETFRFPYLCVGPRGGWQYRGNFATRVMEPATAGRPGAPAVRGHAAREPWEPLAPGLTFHGLRHSHKTMCRDGHLDDVIVREQMGHARSREIGEHYTHPTAGMRAERLALLDDLWVAAGIGGRAVAG